MATEVYVGKDLGVQTFVASLELIQQYLAGIGDRHPWYTGDSSFGGPVAPALIFRGMPVCSAVGDWRTLSATCTRARKGNGWSHIDCHILTLGQVWDKRRTFIFMPLVGRFSHGRTSEATGSPSSQRTS